MKLGAFRTPCKIVGSVRLDDGEYIGSEFGYNYLCSSESDLIEGASDEADVVKVDSLGTTNDEQVSTPNQPAPPARVDNSDESRPANAVGSATVDSNASSTDDCLVQVAFEDTIPHAHDYELPVLLDDVKAHRHLSNEKGTSWKCQNYFFLKNTVLLCSPVEVQGLLEKFMRHQAHAQCTTLKLSFWSMSINLAGVQSKSCGVARYPDSTPGSSNKFTRVMKYRLMTTPSLHSSTKLAET